MSNSNQDFFQSHFIPAEKPYAVYAFPYDSIYISVGQLIETIVTGRVDEKGEVRYKTNAVYRLPSENMLDYEHCFIKGHTAPIETIHLYQLGFVGDTVGLKEVCLLYWMEQTEGEDTCMLKYFIRMMEYAGLKVSVEPQSLKPQEAHISNGTYFNGEEDDYYLAIHDQIAIVTNLSRVNHVIISDIATKLRYWEEIGIKDIHVDMVNPTQQACYEELLDIARLYLKNYKKIKGRVQSDIELFLRIREQADSRRIPYDDFFINLSFIVGEGKAREYIETLIRNGCDAKLLTYEDGVIAFSETIERMVNWKPVF